MQNNYNIYPTLLDAYQDYRRSSIIYDQYYSFSENPPFTEEEFEEKQFKNLIDKINRIPIVDSEAADKGTAFNEVVDCLIHHCKSDKISVERVYKTIANGLTNPSDGKVIGGDVVETDEIIGLSVIYNNKEFYFPIGLCKEFARYYTGAISQLFVSALLPTAYGNVNLYGFIDELMPLSCHDIKTTKRYSVGKFKHHFQHIVYPYCLMKSGADVKTFEYNIAEIGMRAWSSYTETYTFLPERDIPYLTESVEDLIRFINDNRALITDKKIFAENK